MPDAGAVGVIVQVPAVFMVTVVPETVQTLGVELAKVTVVPAESVAMPREKAPAPPATHVCGPGTVQVMLWLAPLIVMLLALPVVEAQLPDPGAVGVMVQVPAVSMVTVVPLTVHTLKVELAKVTVVTAESVAVPREKAPAPPATHVWGPGAVQVMLWLTPLIVMLLALPVVWT